MLDARLLPEIEVYNQYCPLNYFLVYQFEKGDGSNTG